MSELDLAELAARVQRPDEEARRRAEQRLVELPGGAGALGRLGHLAAWMAGVQGTCPTRPLLRSRLVVFAGDHGIAAASVTGGVTLATTRALAEIAAGTAVLSTLATSVGVPVRLVDLAVDADEQDLPREVLPRRVRRGSGRIDREDAITRAEAETAFGAGVALADEEVDSGADLIVCGHVGRGATTVAAVLVAALTRSDAATVCGPGGVIDDATWIRRCAAIRDALRRARPVLGDQLQLLATTGGADLAAITGFLLQSAARRTPVLLDGVVTTASALVAHRIAFRAADWWLAGDVSPDVAHAQALSRLSLEPIQAVGLGLHDGSGSLLAVPQLQAATALLAT